MVLNCEGGQFDGRQVEIRDDDALEPKATFRVAELADESAHVEDYVVNIAGRGAVLRPQHYLTPRSVKVVMPS